MQKLCKILLCALLISFAVSTSTQAAPQNTKEHQEQSSATENTQQTTAGKKSQAPAITLFQDDKSAAIFVYSRIGDEQNPAVSVQVEQFQGHIQELVDGEYNVIALPELVAAFKNNTSLPPKTIAITFDGGHRSVLEDAIPLLESHSFPYTVFFASDRADLAGAGVQKDKYLSWEDLRKIEKSPLGTLGLHPASYSRLYQEEDSVMKAAINKAVKRSREELTTVPSFFAYPFGEYSAPYQDIVSGYDFKASFAQHSAIAFAGSDIGAIPRFSMTERYASIERFQMISNAMPLPTQDLQPFDPFIHENPPSIGFTLPPSLKSVNCFVSGQGRVQQESLGQNRVQLILSKALDQSRVRVNCTSPAKRQSEDDNPTWRWFGRLLVVPDVLLPRDSE